MRILLAILFILPAATAAVAASAPITSNRNPPLFFIPNQGQAPQDVQFMAKGSALTAYFLAGEVALRATEGLVRVQFVGSAVGARIEGADRLPGRVNFLTGPQDQWRTGLPIYGAVAYRGLYAGIDMTYGTNGRQLKSEFTIAAGADSRQIRIRYLGAGPARVDADGSLLVAVSSGTLRELPPTAYQDRAGKRVPVEARFELQSDGTVGFALGRHDPSFPVVIDPVLSYSTLLGGSGADAANAIAVDSTGAAYVAGFTASFDFPSVNPEQGATGGGNDAFIAKLSASGSALIYCTYLGGRGDDRAFGIAVDATGAAYVTGSTESTNFPVRNALQANLAGGKNAFVVKLTPTGNGLVYSTYLGGNGSDAGNGIAVDSSGNAYITGDTTSTNFPANTYQMTYHGSQDAFVSKLNAAGSALTYSTYLGGGSIDHGAAIAVESTGTAYITGSTYSTDFPTLNALQPAIGGGQNAFITRLKADGSGLLFSTYLGGSGGSTGYPESGQGIAVDAAGSAYVAGVTPSPNFPLVNPEQPTLNGSLDAFVAKVSSAGALLYSTYLGGSGIDNANAIAVDANGYAYIAGYTYSSDFPVVSPLQATAGSPTGIDAFVAKLVPAGNTLAFSTYLGGNDANTATGVAIDPSGNVYVAGWTLSTNFPTLNAYQTQNGGNYGAFVTKYLFNTPPADVSVTPNSGSGTAQSFTFQYSDGNGAIDLSTVGASFNTTASQAGACAVIFNSALNTLALLTNSGAQPASPIAPGNGSAQNSQCVLNGGASSVSLSGNVLTLTLALTFQPAFAGVKNIYMQAANPYQTTAWQAEGTWIAPAPVLSISSLHNGSFTQGQASAYTVTVSSQSGVGGTSGTVTVTDTVTSGLTITSLSGAGWNCSTSNCTRSDSLASGASYPAITMTVNVSLTAASPQNNTVNVAGGGSVGASSTDTTVILSAPSPPQALSVTPSSGTGLTQTFSFHSSDGAGSADLVAVFVWITSNYNTGLTANSCFIQYVRAANIVALENDAGTGAATGLLGSAGTLSNSSCSISLASASATSSGTDLFLTLPTAFTATYSGQKSVYLFAAGSIGSSGWQNLGTWTVPAQTPGVNAVAVTPNSGSGATQTFVLHYADTAGAADLSTGFLWITSNYNTVSTANSCFIQYVRASNIVTLENDVGTGAAAGVLGSAGTLSNSSCSISLASASAAPSGADLFLTLPITFTATYSGQKSVYLFAAGSIGSSGWQNLGTWTVPAQTPGVNAVAVMPSSGSGATQTFVLHYADTAGAADLSAGFLWITSNYNTVSTANSCFIQYVRASNIVTLENDVGTGAAAGVLGSAGTLSNSSCSISLASASAAPSGTDLFLTLPITFTATYSGQKSVYLFAAGSIGSSGWQNLGAWTVPAQTPGVNAVAVTPNSGSGATQTFVLHYADTAGAADLNSGYLWITSNYNTVSTANSCFIQYVRAANIVALENDAGTGAATGVLGSAGTLSNSSCSISLASASAAPSGTDLFLTLPITFTATYSGQKSVYLFAAGSIGSSGWQNLGAWTP